MSNKWKQLFFESEIPFYIYKLNKGDSLIFKYQTKYKSLIIVFYGTVYIMKIFTNSESLFLAILTNKSIIDFNFFDSNYVYYKVVALENTYFIKFFWLDYIVHCQYLSTSIKLLDLFRDTLRQYESSSYVLMHKSIRYRVFQLLLLLCKDFGVLNNNNNYVLIPFELSQKTISYIIGSNPITVNKVVSFLIKRMFIKYIVKNKILICYFSFFNYLRNNKIT
uniref:global nitrogen transcriptional regulator n=1 Tax=Gracilaria bursa-pastoris TaxID=172962 RepID=UPI001D128044|nr:global nitrogen transcriptional regulator [Gracilaria bursa-pastoris]UAD83431.1 global nitrogen transcriptional regulator [Gracilaria bursa-pastoris]